MKRLMISKIFLSNMRLINCYLSNRTRININEKINGIINVQLMIINVQNKARSAPKLKR